MTFLEILTNIKNKNPEKTDKNDLIDFINSFEKNINLGIKYNYIKKINIVLNYFKNNNKQLEIINKKFIKLKTRHELFDLLVELVICYKYLNNNPEFIEEKKEETPDIKTDNLVIEIKRIRNSDYENKMIKNIINNKKENNSFIINNQSQNINTQDNMERSLLNKIKQKINKAISQIDKNNGIIYLIFNLDLNRSIDSLKERKINLFNSAKSYFNSKRIKNIKLKVIELNNLLQ